jgi:ribosomal protein S18 acetylase RimI-like enzyme
MPHAPSHPPSVTLAAVQPDDFEELACLRIEAMRESLERVGRFDPQRARTRLHAGFCAGDTRHIEVAGQRVGFVVLRTHADGLFLEHLYIHPRAQAMGIGGTVLSGILADADAGGQEVRVDALRDSGSNRFYVRHGFSIVGQSQFDNHYVRPGRPQR